MSTQNPGDPLPIDSKQVVNSKDPDSTKKDIKDTFQSELPFSQSESGTSTLTLPFRPADHHSTMPAVRKQSVNKLPQVTKARSWAWPTRNRPRPTLPDGQRRALRAQAAQDALKVAKEIVDSCEGGFGISVKISHGKATTLEPTLKHPRFPNYPTTQVKVINKDTLDAALALHNAGDIMGIKSTARVCVLNFANARTPGGGWLNGASAQEEQICYRSTLGYSGLLKEFYPWKPDEGLYTSNVLIFRENEDKGYSWMWTKKPEWLPMIAVVSVAATQGPPLDRTNTKYHNDSERTLMEEKMRFTLRLAADFNHTRLVLGALGCGAFRHPAGEVADCWVRVLQEKEFKGWFEFIVFAVLDKKDGVNITTFKKALHNLEM
jgi:uncharacterized protein (TIGR02452 family)